MSILSTRLTMPLSRRTRTIALHARLAPAILTVLILVYGLGFGALAVERHMTLQTHAEDLGFTDQVIWNFLRGQAFRFSLYDQAEWRTDLDLAEIRRPDSLLAFHVEPMLVLFAPLYVFVPDVRVLLWLQALLVALGAIPAYRFARRRLGESAGLMFAGVYLLAPLGQWAVLSDFHTVALAAPLLMLAIDALDARRFRLFLIAGVLAMSTKEEIGLVFAGLGVLALFRPESRRWGAVAIVLGGGWSLLCVGLIIPYYSGNTVSPLEVRYSHLGKDPVAAVLTLFRTPDVYLESLTRPEVYGYAVVLLLAGAWIAIAAPELLLPASLILALNVLSSSPWMASGRAHYSASVLPFVVAAAVVGSARVSHVLHLRATVLPMLVLLGALLAYGRAGAGPLADGFVPPVRQARHERATQLAASIAPDVRVSASSSLVPHLSQRASVYLFPTIRDAEYILIDVTTDPFPVSAGVIHRRVQELLDHGEAMVLDSDDGIILLKRQSAATRPLPERFFDFARAIGPVSPEDPSPEGVSGVRTSAPTQAGFRHGTIEMVSARLVPMGAPGPRGPLATLETVWMAQGPVAGRPRPSLEVHFRDGSSQHVFDLASVWWYPPEHWRPGELVRLDASGLPLHDVKSWEPRVSVAEEPALTAVQPGASPAAQDSAVPPAQLPGQLVNRTETRLGDLTGIVVHDPFRLTLLDPVGRIFWDTPEARPPDLPFGALGFRDVDGRAWRLTRLLDVASNSEGARLTVATDDPSGRTASVELRSLDPTTVRVSLEVTDPTRISALGGATFAAPEERLLGFGERFTGVDQRGQMVRTWAEDRRVAGFGNAAYAPIPFYISSRGYSFLVESDARGQFDVARSQPEWISWEIEQPAVSMVLSYGPSPRDLILQHARLTGLPPLPPIWAFGVWKTAVGGQEQVLRDAARLRTERLPVSALFVYDADDAESFFGWPHVVYGRRTRGTYPNLRALNDRLHASGFKSLGYKNVEFRSDRPDHAEAARLGMLVRDATGAAYVHPEFGVSWVDFTHSEVLSWWNGLWRRIVGDLDFDGAMLDLAENVPAEARYADGSTGIETHNRYVGLFAQASFDAVRAVRGDDFVLFSRSGSRGAQRYQSLQWSGDQTITWEQDGLRGLVPAALSWGLSGFPYWHPEVGGFIGAGLPQTSERELWFRWLQLGALSPTLRDQYGEHTGDPVEVWSDDETVAQFREYARLHNRLVPYLYSQARIASETGLPIIRHLILSTPDDPRAWDQHDVYTLGDDLLVAPVLEEGARHRTLYLPHGSWVDWWTGEHWTGGRTVTVEAPLHRIPLFARSGAIIPLATAFDTLAPTSDPSVLRWNGDLVVRVIGPRQSAERPWSPGDASSRLYDGTTFQTRESDGVFAMSVASPSAIRTYTLEIPLQHAPSQVLLDGTAADGWTYSDGVMSMTVRSGPFTVTVRQSAE